MDSFIQEVSIFCERYQPLAHHKSAIDELSLKDTQADVFKAFHLILQELKEIIDYVNRPALNNLSKEYRLVYLGEISGLVTGLWCAIGAVRTINTEGDNEKLAVLEHEISRLHSLAERTV